MRQRRPPPQPTDVFRGAARRYADHSETSPHNAYYERPAVRALVGPPEHLSVIDVGCGGGALMEAFIADRAGRIAGIESDPVLAQIARERVGRSATVLQHNIEAPLPAAWNASFDIAVSSLVLHYIADWTRPLRHIRDVLRPGGRLVFSVQHPMSDFALGSGRYFETEAISYYWKPLGVDVSTFRRPLCDMVNAVIDAGFRLDRVVEPQPQASMRESHPDVFEELVRTPAFIIFAATKDR